MFEIWFYGTGIVFSVATILCLTFYGKESKTAKMIQTIAPALAISFGTCNIFVCFAHVVYGF